MNATTTHGTGGALALALLVAWAGSLGAQEGLTEHTELPPEVAGDVLSFVNDSSTIRLDGGGRIPRGRTLSGGVAALDGFLVLAGEIDGDLVVVNGDLELRPGSRVRGDVTVVGGGIRGRDEADVGGTVAVYAERLRYVREGGRIEGILPGDRQEEGLSSSLGFGRSRITVRAGTNYNRVEGLPVMFGPIIETASSNPLRLEALAVWRSDRGFTVDTGDLGYRVSLEQYLGGRELFSVGASAFSLVAPMERWTVTDLEGSLATFLFHRDYRDYFERSGWSGFVRLHSPSLPLSVRLEYRDEDHGLARVGSPWALKANDEPWRPLPLVAEGRIRMLEGAVTLDTRNDRARPTDGWWIQARSTVGVGGSPEIREHLLPGTGGAVAVTVPATRVDRDFAAGFLDARSYNRIGPSSELVVRAVLGGSLTGEPLPPQFQHAAGGEGSLPAFSFFAADCGARSVLAQVPLDGEDGTEPVFPAYGCDRMALFQAEVRGGMGWSLDLGGEDPEAGEWQEAWGWDSPLELRPRWSAFLDAGRGWALGGSSGAPRHDEDTRLDVGLGVLLGDLGLYVAFPLTGEEDGVNFFLRLTRRL